MAEDIGKATGERLAPPAGGIVSASAWRFSWQLANGRPIDAAFLDTECDKITRDILEVLVGGVMGRVARPIIRALAGKFPAEHRRRVADSLERALDRLTEDQREKLVDFLGDLIRELRGGAAD